MITAAHEKGYSEKNGEAAMNQSIDFTSFKTPFLISAALYITKER
jgi:hypothetical protein